MHACRVVVVLLLFLLVVGFNRLSEFLSLLLSDICQLRVHATLNASPGALCGKRRRFEHFFRSTKKKVTWLSRSCYRIPHLFPRLAWEVR